MVPFGVKFIAANSDGERKQDLGVSVLEGLYLSVATFSVLMLSTGQFVYPGTGDVEGSFQDAFL